MGVCCAGCAWGTSCVGAGCCGGVCWGCLIRLFLRTQAGQVEGQAHQVSRTGATSACSGMPIWTEPSCAYQDADLLGWSTRCALHSTFLGFARFWSLAVYSKLSCAVFRPKQDSGGLWIQARSTLLSTLTCNNGKTFTKVPASSQLLPYDDPSNIV